MVPRERCRCNDPMLPRGEPNGRFARPRTPGTSIPWFPVNDIDELIVEAGQTHVIPPREDQALLARVRDPRVLARAMDLLRSKDARIRRHAILCVERIGFAIGDQETAELLLRHADSTKDKYEAATALDALEHLDPPQPLPPKPLVRLALRPDWLVWQAAVRCLHMAPVDRVEPALLDRMDSDRYGLPYVARELRYMRSEASIQALEQLLSHASLDVRCVALDSLGERLGPGVVQYARRFAVGRMWQEKVSAETWLARFGEPDDLPFMAERGKSLAGGKRRIMCEPPEVSHVVPFLLSHMTDPRARAALDAIRRHADRLLANEREWLEHHAPEVLMPGE
jgi:HEAT repeats